MIVFRFGLKKKLLKSVNDTFEIGGVLIGYKILNLFIIEDFTMPKDTTNMATFENSFNLIASDHQLQANVLLEKYYKSKVIGLWHSHVNNDIYFSIKDNKSNEHFASIFGEIISIIIVKKSKFIYKKICNK